MSNIHSVIQVKPFVILEGACIPMKQDQVNIQLFEKLCQQPHTEKIMGKWYDAITV
jgi:hypothetical protein